MGPRQSDVAVIGPLMDADSGTFMCASRCERRARLAHWPLTVEGRPDSIAAEYRAPGLEITRGA